MSFLLLLLLLFFSFNFNLLILFGTSLSGGGPVVDAYSRVYRRYIFDISSLPTDANAMSHGYLAFIGWKMSIQLCTYLVLF